MLKGATQPPYPHRVSVVITLGVHHTLVMLLFLPIGCTNLQSLSIPVSIANKIGPILALIGLLWSFVERKKAMTYSVLMLSIGLFLPLLSSFAVYFLAQHSLYGWMHLKKGLNTNNLQLYKKALPFNLGAIFFFALTIYLVQSVLLKTLKISSSHQAGFSLNMGTTKQK